MICSSRRTSRPKSFLNSHLDERMGNLPVLREWTTRRSDEFREFSWKVNIAEGKKAAKKRTKENVIKKGDHLEFTLVNQTVERFDRPNDLFVF